MQSQPDIVEIEVSAEGQWRPAGSTERWRDITEDLSTAAITAPVVKQELKNDAQVSSQTCGWPDKVGLTKRGKL